MDAKEKRSPLFLLTGLVLGLLLGLGIAWLLFPARTVDTGPAELHAQYKEDYRATIALAYASSGDLGRAQARLVLLSDLNPSRELTEQAQFALLDQDNQREARALGQLALALQALPPADIPDSVAQPNLAADSAYEIVEQQMLCEEQSGPPLLKIFLLDAEGLPQSGISLHLLSDNGEEETFTGLRPEFGAGYAQFELIPSEVYTMSVAGDVVLENLQAAVCEGEMGVNSWGIWLFTLRVNS
jgi:hypothetical protein